MKEAGVYPHVSLGLVLTSSLLCSTSSLWDVFNNTQDQLQDSLQRPRSPGQATTSPAPAPAGQSDLEFMVSSTKPYKAKSVQVVKFL